jgi:hypothetical protein
LGLLQKVGILPSWVCRHGWSRWPWIELTKVGGRSPAPTAISGRLGHGWSALQH